MKRCVVLLAMCTAVVFAETPGPAFQFDWKSFSSKALPRDLRLVPPQFLAAQAALQNAEAGNGVCAIPLTQAPADSKIDPKIQHNLADGKIDPMMHIPSTPVCSEK